MGWHDAVDSFGDAVTSGIESAIEAGGELIDAGEWAGDAASAFHDEYGKQPRLWWQGSDAMGRASTALQAWFYEVDVAQVRAAEAIAVWDRAEREEKTRKGAWNALSDDRKRDSPLVDTWTALREQAQEIPRCPHPTRQRGVGHSCGVGGGDRLGTDRTTVPAAVGQQLRRRGRRIRVREAELHLRAADLADRDWGIRAVGQPW